MTRINNTPPYAEEKIIQEEQLNLQQILNQFKQLVPVGFVKLETKDRNYMCSTQSWKEPVCERYMFSARGQSLQIDIPRELMADLGLAEDKDKDKNIYYPVYISPEVLKRQPIQLGITIKKEEIFIQKPLTINNLVQELNRIWEQIQKLENDKETNQQTILNLEKQLAEQEKIKKIWRDKYLEEKGNNNQSEEKDRDWQDQKQYLEQTLQAVNEEVIKNYQELTNSKNQAKQLLRRLAIRRIELFALNRKLNARPNVTQQQYNDLLQRPTLAEVELAQTDFSQLTNQILELEQKLNLAQSELLTIPTNWKTRLTETKQRISNLEREKEQLNNDLQSNQQELAQKDEEITRLRNVIIRTEKERDDRTGDITLDQWNNDYKNRPTQQQLTNLQNQLTSTQQQLQKELSWWDKWESDIVALVRGEQWEISEFLSKKHPLSYKTTQITANFIQRSGQHSKQLVVERVDFIKTSKGAVGEGGNPVEFFKYLYEYYKNK